MSDRTILSPTHAALIKAARLRDDHHLLPPERVRGGARRRLADKLIALGLVQAVPGEEAVWWVDPDRGSIGLRLTTDVDGATGRTKTGGGGADDRLINEPARMEASVPHPAEPRGWTKIARVLLLLRRVEGADLAVLVAATGWLPHTTRAALTDLRRKGHAILTERRECDGRTVYRIAAKPQSTSATAEAAQTSSEAPR